MGFSCDNYLSSILQYTYHKKVKKLEVKINLELTNRVGIAIKSKSRDCNKK